MIVSGLDHTRATVQLLDGAAIRVAEIMDVDGRPIDIATGFSHRDGAAPPAARLSPLRLCRARSREGPARRPAPSQLRAVPGASRHRCAGRGTGAGAEIRRERPSRARRASAKSARRRRGGLLRRRLGGRRRLSLRGAGIAPKTELGLFGFNGPEIGESLPHPLSTIRSNRHCIGQIAVETCMRDANRPASGTVIDTGFEIVADKTT